MLHTIHNGEEATGTPLVIAHGLFGSGRNWGAIAKRLAKGRPVVSVDMRNHGTSPWYPSHTYADMAADLAAVVEAAGAPCDVLGHSMGGKAAMVLAVTRPDLVSRLIVADIAPVAYAHTQTPLIDAMQALDLTSVGSRRDADEGLADAIPETPVRAFLIQSLELRDPPVRWRLNLDALRANMDDIIRFPDLNGRFEGPALFLHGGASDYVLPEHHGIIRTLFPAAVFQDIPGAGHWVHAEAPAPFIEATQSFLAA